ncbi:MAG: DUF561 domain-containing protein [Cyanobacteria bacterium HKST-UBA04]|nr:DUF561 domain-containing protein [Cyanobacteria bacterium HKST-UBA04]MCA9841581.1 DUF561 domain-containing protein [Cyanobacteria bacterium HKST-UBA03]
MSHSNPLLKVIAGIANFDADRVERVCQAAETVNADWVDLACDVRLLAMARRATTCPLMISSVDAQNLIEAASWGVDALEVGNFDALYDQGFFITAGQVHELARQVITAVGGRVPVSVTVPGHLSQEAQLALALELETLGAAMLQTEGASAVVTLNKTVQPVSAEEKAQRTLAHVRLLSQVVSIPVIAASGLYHGNVAEAIGAGAAGVGIGSAINRLPSVEAMVDELQAIQTVLGNTSTAKPAVAVARNLAAV